VNKTEAKTIQQDIENGTLPIEAVCEMLANSLDANALFISLFQREQDTVLSNGAMILDEFIATSKGMLTGSLLMERLLNKYVSREQERADTLALALDVLKGAKNTEKSLSSL